MSDDNHAGTPPQGDNGSPWARGDSSWQPASYRDTPGRDPRVPFGHPPAGAAAPEPHIEEFTPPRQSRTRPALLIAGVVGVVALLLLALQFLGSPDGAPAASPSATPGQATGDQTAAPVPAATSGTSIPFEGNGTGTFEIRDQTWTSEGLRVRYRVSVDAGEQSFSLYLFNNASMEVSDPVDLAPFYASEGSPHEGSAVFPVERGESTLVLASGFGRALTALPISD